MHKRHASMNRAFRVVWNEHTGTYQAVSELAKGHGGRGAGLLLSALLGLSLPGIAAEPTATALPTGGQIVSGSGSISQAGAAMTIQQSSDRLIANWNTFNIGQNASVQFIQPSSSSVALNRVLSADPSYIYGNLTANGQIFLLNPSGVIFGPTARVDVGGLVASSLNLSNDDFLAGRHQFIRDAAAGAVTNAGRIQAGNGGYIAFLAPRVQNNGDLIADQGKVVLAAGDKISLNFTGDLLINFTIDQGAVNALAENKQLIQAAGGTVILSAKAADALTQSVVNNSGVIEASSLNAKGGRIVLEGDAITLSTDSRIEAKGATGGGDVLVGGDWQGSGPMRQATTVSMEGGAVIDASATQNGDGGKVVLWSDVNNPNSRTDVRGSIRARGGEFSGHGGQIETSGQRVAFGEAVSIDTGATSGNAGQWLIDPVDFTISASGGDITGSALGSLLGSNNVTIQTATGTNTATNRYGAVGTNGDIFVNDTVNWSANTLTLSAHRNINFNTSITASGTGKLALEYGQGAVASGNSAKYTIADNVKINLPAGANFSTKLGSDGVTTPYTVINSTTSFTNSSMVNSSGKFALGADIDFAAVGAQSGGFVWQNAAGFVLDGLGHTLSNISIAPTWAYQGVFGYNYGTIRNIDVNNLTFTSTTHQSLGFVGLNNSGGVVEGIKVSGTSNLACSHYCGPVVGNNATGGIVRNFMVTGAVNFNNTTYTAGGAIGYNGGTVSNGTNSATVTFTYTDNGSSSYGGMIGANNLGTADNLTFSGTMALPGARTGYTGIQNGIGGIIGWNGSGYNSSDPSTLSNSTFSGTMTLGSGAYIVGGLVGYNHATIQNSTNTGSVVVGNNSYFVGGITGWSVHGAPAMTSVSSHGLVTAGTGSEYVGGIAGYNSGNVNTASSSSVVTISGTNASANIGVSGPYLGKLFGGNGGTLTNTNYQTPITVSVSPVTITYGATPVYTFALVSGTLSGGDTLGSLLTGAPVCLTCTNVGTYSVTQNTVALNNVNYYMTWQNGSLTVNPASLTVTASNASKTYNGATYSGGNGVSYSGFVNGETAAVLGGTLSYGGTAQGAVNAGTYSIVASGLSTSNYNISYVNGNLTVNPAALTVTAASASKAYNGVAYSGGNGVSYSGFVNGETSTVLGGTLSYGGTAQGVKDAGTYTISPLGLTAANYTISYVDGELTITGQAQTPYTPLLTNTPPHTLPPVGASGSIMPAPLFNTMGGTTFGDTTSGSTTSGGGASIGGAANTAAGTGQGAGGPGDGNGPGNGAGQGLGPQGKGSTSTNTTIASSSSGGNSGMNGAEAKSGSSSDKNKGKEDEHGDKKKDSGKTTAASNSDSSNKSSGTSSSTSNVDQSQGSNSQGKGNTPKKTTSFGNTASNTQTTATTTTRGNGANSGGGANTVAGTGQGAGGPGDGTGPGNGAGQGLGPQGKGNTATSTTIASNSSGGGTSSGGNNAGGSGSTTASGNGANSGGGANTVSGTGQGAGGPGDGNGPGNGAGQGLGPQGKGITGTNTNTASTSSGGTSGGNSSGGSGSTNSGGAKNTNSSTTQTTTNTTASSGNGANSGGGVNTVAGTGQGAGGPGDGNGPGNGAGQGLGSQGKGNTTTNTIIASNNLGGTSTGGTTSGGIPGGTSGGNLPSAGNGNNSGRGGLSVPGVSVTFAGSGILLSGAASGNTNANPILPVPPAGETVRNAVSVVVMRSGVPPVAEKGFEIKQSNAELSLNPVDRVEQGVSAPGRVMGSARFAMNNALGVRGEFMTEVTEGGLVIRMANPLAREMAEGRRDLVVATAMREVQKQLSVTADKIRAVFIDLR